jgi:ribosome-associated protein
LRFSTAVRILIARVPAWRRSDLPDLAARRGAFGARRRRRGRTWPSAAIRPVPRRCAPGRRLLKDKETVIASSSPSPGLDQIVKTILASLNADSAQDILDIDLVGKTSIADRMIVASGTSARMVSALAQHLVTKLKDLGLKPRSEGEQHGDWVLVDVGDVIVHLFRPEVRAFYDLERIWTTPLTPPMKVQKPARKAAKPRAKAAPKSASKAVRKKPARKPAR